MIKQASKEVTECFPVVSNCVLGLFLFTVIHTKFLVGNRASSGCRRYERHECFCSAA